jgi:ribose transport system substrate-binding protein
MSRFGKYLALAPLVLPLLNCGGSPHSADEKYYLLVTNVKEPYWQEAGAGLSKAASQMRVLAEMVGPDSYDVTAQHTQFQDLLKKKPTGILVTAGNPALIKQDIDAAAAQGVPVITIDSDAPASNRLTFIGTDNYQAGQMGGKVAAKALKFRGNVVVYTMPEQNNLKDRLRGYKDVFDGYPQIKISEVVDIKGQASAAFDKTMDLIDKNEKVDAFVCLVSIACPEVADVLGRKNVTGKVVVAMDSEQRTLEAIQKGVISATIGQKPFTMAFFGLQTLDSLHHHPLSSMTKDWSLDLFAPVPAFVDTGVTLIDKDNVDKFIQARNSATGK